MSRRRRSLRPEELELWEKVASSTERLVPARKTVAQPVVKKERRQVPEDDPPAPHHDIMPFQLGQKASHSAGAHDLLAPIGERLRSAPVRMDKKTHTRMTKGKLLPEARIDLHGMTVERAHQSLRAFIFRSVQNECRLVLVITGKGRKEAEDGPIPVRHGVLRHQLPHWLSIPPLSQLVLQVTSAHARHGGAGAYYIYLRRNR